MYSNCIFCSAALGRNEALEHFPVGSRLAFDAWKGRLWAVCPGCARWNLSPIEERWEAVEEAERLFRDCRLKVQSENVGLAKLPDGTRLVRVGEAVPGEMAAWRYGGQLLQRRRRYVVGTGLAVGAGLVAWGGISAMGVGFGGTWFLGSWLNRKRQQKVIYRLKPSEDPAGHGAVIRRWHVKRIDLQRADDAGGLAVYVRDGRREPGRKREDGSPRHVIVSGEPARALLSRAMVQVNRSGATRSSLQQAERILLDQGSAEQVLRAAAARRATLSDKAAHHARALAGPDALALEMALNEESERRALEGELAALEAAWREAEEIAAIADALPGEALVNRLLDRLAR
jgi:hypothetical protein